MNKIFIIGDFSGYMKKHILPVVCRDWRINRNVFEMIYLIDYMTLDKVIKKLTYYIYTHKYDRI